MKRSIRSRIPEKLRPVVLAGWVLFFAAFAGMGGIHGWKEFRQRTRVKDQAPDNTTEVVFSTLVRGKDATMAIARCIKDVPPDEPIAVLFWDPPRSQLAAIQLGTFLWPHPAPQIECRSTDTLPEALSRSPVRPYSAFLVGVIMPEPRPGIQSLGPFLHYLELPR